MRVIVRVQKFNPEKDVRPHPADYSVEVGRGATVLSALMKIKAELDGSLTFRASCRSAICGSCLMMVNGVQRLACETSVYDEVEKHEKVHVGPMENFPVIKDLVTDNNDHWRKVREIDPWVTRPGESPLNEEPATAPAPPILPRQMAALNNSDACIMCGACLSACTSYQVSPSFLGPAALAKAYRVVADPREGRLRERLAALQGAGGIWDCCRCNYCVEVCPKDVRPLEQIVHLRRLSIEMGLKQELGARHITEFFDIVREEGRLNERRMPAKMVGFRIGDLLRILPLGIRMALKGKVPLAPFKKIAGIRQIRKIFSLIGHAEQT